MDKDLLNTLTYNLDMISEYDISEDLFYSKFSKSYFKKLLEAKNNGYKTYQKDHFDRKKLEGVGVIEQENIKGCINEIFKSTQTYKAYDILKNGVNSIENNTFDIRNIISPLQDLEYASNDEFNSIVSTDYIDEYKKQTEELEKSDKTRFYTFSHPVLKKYLRMEKGWSGNLLGGTASGKTIVACILSVDFVKNYKEKILFVTDENSKENILQYLHCAYFGLHFRSVQDRTIKLDEHISGLSKKKREEYEELFNLIEVWELQGIPLSKVKRKIKNSDNKYGLVVLDSFDEINSMMGQEEVIRYESNGKLTENMAKELDIILMVTGQLDTKLYSTSAEKLPQLCNHQAKSLVKKHFFSLVIHKTYTKDGDVVDDVIKLNKSRSGGTGVMYAIKKNYDFISLDVEDKEYDLDRLKNNKKIECDF